MESVLSNFDIENKKNFWKLYPSWKTPRLYNELYTNDKSKNKDISSDIMWGIVHLYDKSEVNPFRNYPITEKMELVATDVFDNEKYDWSSLDKLMDLTSQIMETEEERELSSFSEFMGKRRELIQKEEADMTLAKLKDIDEARKRNQINMTEYKRLKDLVALKAEGGQLKGDLIESAKEKGLL